MMVAGRTASSVDHADHASPLWDRAEQCKALSDIAKNKQLRRRYRRLAALYLEIAAKEDELVRSIIDDPITREGNSAIHLHSRMQMNP
jgi:alkylhydroperoxidase/carboxymuconolactone decarboxylase family protein YurZ